MEKSKEKIILAEGKFSRFVVQSGWEFAERVNISGIVVIVAITDENKLLLVEQYRPPVSSNVIEFPAGLAGDIETKKDEPLEAAALRELEEETGYTAKEMTYLTQGPTSSGLCSEVVTFFLAKGLTRISSGGGDETENIIVHEIDMENIESWLLEKGRGNIYIDPKVYAGLFFLR